MDTSETYIKMCEKAVEIQAGKKFQGTEVGDYFYDHDKGLVAWQFCMANLIPIRYIYLPTQDQLQEMVEVDYKELLFLLDVFIDVIDSTRIYDYITSMEQLWLAFVYKEKYNKVWNGTDWVADKVLESKTAGEK